MANDLIILHKTGKWYLKYPEYGGWTEGYRCDGIIVKPLPDRGWTAVSFPPPYVIERLVPPSSKIVGYRIKPEFAQTGLPAEVPPDHFAEHEDDDEEIHRTNAETFALYAPVLEESEPYWKPVEWNQITADLDCEPCKMMLPVKVAFPQCVAEYRETHHKYPCTLHGDDLFDILFDRVAAVVKQSENLKMEDFKNIRVLDVDRKVYLAEPDTRSEKVGRRTKTWTVNHRWDRIIALHGPSYRSPGRDGYTPTLSATNYAEMEKEVEKYIGQWLELLVDEAWQVCPQCKGRGEIRRP